MPPAMTGRSVGFRGRVTVAEMARSAPGTPPPGTGAGGGWLSELAGLVVACGLPGDDVEPIPGVDPGDERHQRTELLVVVVLGRIRPGLIGDTASGVGDAGAQLGKFQRGPLSLGEHRRLPPRRDQVEP